MTVDDAVAQHAADEEADNGRPVEVSPQAAALRTLYEGWSDVLATTPDLSTRLMRALLDEHQQMTREPTDVTYAEDTVGVRGIWALPLGADRSSVLLYLHGGGFAAGSPASHRKLAGHLAKALGVTAFVPDYRLAPEYRHPAQVEDGAAVFAALLERGSAAADITTIGDSAGGNLAVAVPLLLRDRGLPLPGRIVAFSPWFDMANASSSLITNDATDPLTSLALMQGMAAGVLGDSVDPTTALANPLHADLAGLPPLYLNAGSVEGLLGDAVRLADRARAAGVDVTLSIVEGMLHVFPMLAGNAPEADRELAALAAWYHRSAPSTPDR